MLHYVSITFIFLFLSCVGSEDQQEQYTRRTGQQPISSHQILDSVYDSFEKIIYDKLPIEYINYTDPERLHKSELKNKEFLVIRGLEVYKYIVGNHTVERFLTTDKYFLKNKENPDQNNIQFCLLDKNLLHLILDFILKLDRLGYNKNGFIIREAYRHPFYNFMK